MKAKERTKVVPMEVIHKGRECDCTPAHGNGVYHHYDKDGKRVRCDCPNES